MEYFNTISEFLTKRNISEFQRYDDFHILRFKDHLDVIPLQTEFVKCNFFQIIITKNHNVDVKLGLNDLSAKPASINFISVQQAVSSHVKSIEEDGVAYMLLFSPSFFHVPKHNIEVLKQFPYFNINTYSSYALNKKNSMLFFHYMETLYTFFNKKEQDVTEILQSYLCILLQESKTYFKEEVIPSHIFLSRQSEVCFKFESLIKQFSSSKHTIDFYANKLNISAVYLAECIKHSSGKTFKKVLNEYVILEAKSILTHTTKPIKEISFLLGYSEPGNFTSFFKKETGQTPNQYRLTKT